MPCLDPIYSDCIRFTAGLTARLGALGYTAKNFEDLLIEIIEKEGASAATRLAALETTVKGISTASMPANARLFGLSTGSVDAALIPDRTMTYKQVGNQLTFDFTPTKQSLPAGFTFLGGSVTVVGADGKRAVSTGSMGVVQTPKLPAQAFVSANIQTANGLITLDKNLYISGDVESSAVLTPRDLNSAPVDMTTQGAIELLAAEVVALKQRI